MATFNKFQPFVNNLASGGFNLGSDTVKVCLTNSAPLNTYSTYSQLTEIGSGAGYPNGGATVTLTSSSQSGGTYIYIASCANPTWTSSGSFATFLYVVIYDTAGSKYLIGYWDYGSAVTLASGNTFYVQLDPTNGVFQLA